MAQIRHIAIQTQDEEATANFYCENFGLKKVRKLDSERTSGYYLTDGHINLAVLRFKNDQVAGAERGTGWSGIHHIGFQVESLEETERKLAASARARPRQDINEALGLVEGSPRMHAGNVEVRYAGPDNVDFDISETGWAGTPTDKARR
jgi:catechol 2,3-dioxygenase-like lactoylglutathione lyase family enzyme